MEGVSCWAVRTHPGRAPVRYTGRNGRGRVVQISTLPPWPVWLFNAQSMCEVHKGRLADADGPHALRRACHCPPPTRRLHFLSLPFTISPATFYAAMDRSLLQFMNDGNLYLLYSHQFTRHDDMLTLVTSTATLTLAGRQGKDANQRLLPQGRRHTLRFRISVKSYRIHSPETSCPAMFLSAHRSAARGPLWQSFHTGRNSTTFPSSQILMAAGVSAYGSELFLPSEDHARPLWTQHERPPHRFH